MPIGCSRPSATQPIAGHAWSARLPWHYRVTPEPVVEVFTGVVEGSVARERRGAGGFGYDPIFLLPSGVTTAELPAGEKDRVSHRGRAVAAATPRLLQLLAER